MNLPEIITDLTLSQQFELQKLTQEMTEAKVSPQMIEVITGLQTQNYILRANVANLTKTIAQLDFKPSRTLGVDNLGLTERIYSDHEPG